MLEAAKPMTSIRPRTGRFDEWYPRWYRASTAWVFTSRDGPARPARFMNVGRYRMSTSKRYRAMRWAGKADLIHLCWQLYVGLVVRYTYVYLWLWRGTWYCRLVGTEVNDSADWFVFQGVERCIWSYIYSSGVGLKV